MSRHLDRSHQARPRGFASDNAAGICPEAWAMLAEANNGHAPSYGEDQWTARLTELIQEQFEADCEIHVVFNGTAANALVLAHLCRPYHAVICTSHAHIQSDECAAPQFFMGGGQLIHAESAHGKLDAKAVAEAATTRDDVHAPKPRALSVTQTTEFGTVYTPDELKALHTAAHRHGLHIHMDGARFANAVAALGCRPADISWRAGVDVLCLGCTKNGLHAGEIVVWFDKNLAAEFAWRAKQAGHLASKQRFLSAPMIGLFTNGAWLRNAMHANAMARQLADGLSRLHGVELAYPCEANGVFVRFPHGLPERLHARGWHFYELIPGVHRLMCAWDTTPDDVESFLHVAANEVSP